MAHFTETDQTILKLASEVSELKAQVEKLTEYVNIMATNQSAYVEQANNDRKRARNLAGYAFMMGR